MIVLPIVVFLIGTIDGTQGQGTCNPPCQNGTCVSLNNCSCITGWSGNLCQYAPHKSCEEAVRNNNFITGYYWLQPDEISSPINVICSKRDNAVSTTLSLNGNQAKGNVTAGKQGTLTRFTYTVSNLGIRNKFVDAQSDCKQYVSASCYNSLFVGTNNVKLKDRNNADLTYWGGADSTGKGCSCGITKSCSYANNLCNCDANREVLDKDEGFISDRAKLPLTGIYIQDTTQKEGYVSYDVSNVECTHKLGTENVYRSCSEALLMNNFQYKLYSIKPSGSNTEYLVMCKLSGSTVTTEFHHDNMPIQSSIKTNLYEKEFNYSIHGGADKVATYISNHTNGNCKQYIKINCYSSVITFPFGVVGLYLYDKDGNKYDTVGGTSATRRCPCAKNFTCYQPNKLCNCDENAEKWSMDEGYMAKKLPVTKLTSTDVNQDNEYLSFVLGPVQCTDYLQFPVPNIALEKNASQSAGIFKLATADKALSSPSNKIYQSSSEPPCSRTGVVDNPWWLVDFGKPIPFSAVKLYARSDLGWNGIKGKLQVTIGNVGDCGKGLNFSRNEILQLQCMGVGQQLTVRVDAKATDLSLCGVEAFVPNSQINQAAGKIAKQSHTYSQIDGPAERANDGGLVTQYNKTFDGACTQTQTLRDPWWKVEFGESFSVSVVKVLSGPLTNSDLTNFGIYVGDQKTCIEGLQLGKEQTGVYKCWYPLSGKELQIKSFGSSKVLSLCEVEVFGRREATESKPAIYYSCLDALKYNKGADGKYLIQPGYLDKPLPVECKLQNGTIVTILTHNSNQEVLSADNRTQGGNLKKILYHADLTYINRFIDKQISCRQYTRAVCLGTRFVGEGYVWLTDRNGERLSYWGGGNASLSSCACYKGPRQNLCRDQSYRCNCDKGDNVSSVDDGYVTDKTKLPLTNVHAVNTSSFNDQWHLNITIGNVECLESKPEKHQSCLDALIWDGKYPTGNGTYDIYPSFMSGAVSTLCVATSGSVKATFPHGNSERTLIRGFTTPESFVKSFSYKGDADNMQYYIAKTAECKQHFKYECTNAPFENGNTIYTRLYNRNNASLSYIGSGHTNYNVSGIPCSCYPFCTANKLCNCNNIDNKEHIDEGYMSRKSDLPITTLKAAHIDNKNSGTGAYYTLGPVECTRQQQIQKIPDGYMLHVRVRSETLFTPAGLRARGFTNGKATIEVNGVDLSLSKRGHNIVTVNPSTGMMIDRIAIDTSADMGYQTKLADFLNNTPNNSIVLIAIQEEGTNSVNAADLQTELLKIKGAKAPIKKIRSIQYVLVGYKGTTTPAWAVQLQQETVGETEISVAIKLQAEIYKSCIEALLDKKVSNGYFAIDHPSMKEIVYAKCYKKGNDVITSFGHNGEVETKVQGYRDRYSYRKNLEYIIPDATLRNFIDSHGKCRQYVKLSCNGSVPKYFQAFDRDGKVFKHWGGGFRAPTIIIKFRREATETLAPGCYCGLTAKCASGINGECNCHAKALPGTRTDEGYMIENSKLPITAFEAGDVGSSGEMIWHTIGSVECYDRIASPIGFELPTPTLTSSSTSGSEFVNTVVTFNCSIPSASLYSVYYTWLRNDMILAEAQTTNTYKLNVTKTSVGSYKCIVVDRNNFLDYSTSNTFFLMVKYVDTPVLKIDQPNPLAVQINTQFRLSCSIRAVGLGIIQANFYRGSTFLSLPRIPVLLVTATKLSSGTYYCRAKVSLPETQPSNNVTVNVVYTDDPVIQVNSQTLDESQGFSISCSVESSPTANLTLQKDGKILSNPLFISKVSREDAGTYECIARTAFYEKNSSMVITVNYMDKPTLIVPMGNVKAGTRATLQCKIASNMADVRYRFVTRGSPGQLSSDSKYTLVASKSNSGTYYCVTEKGNHKKYSDPKEFTVIYFNGFNVSNIAGIRERDTLYFIVTNVDANPAPVFTYRDITTGLNGIINNSLAVIPDFRRGGLKGIIRQFLVIGENAFGKREMGPLDVRLHFMDKPTITIEPAFSFSDWYNEGVAITIKCKANVTSASSMVLSRYHNSVRQEFCSCKELTHKLVNTGPIHNGIYRCSINSSGSNPAAERISDPVTIKIAYVRMPVITGLSNNVPEGETLTLTCKAEGAPTPITYQWFYVREKNQTSMTVISSSSELTIFNASRGSSGYYYCKATNGQNTVTSEKYQVVVQYMSDPQLQMIAPSSLPAMVKEFTSVQILCKSIASFSKINRVMYKDGNQFMTPAEYLINTTSITRTLSATYYCSTSDIDATYLKSSPPLTLTVSYLDQPTISSIPAQNLTEGERVKLTCNVVAFPMPTITWTKSGVALASHNTTIIDIPNAARNVTGSYECCASNHFGKKCSRPTSFKIWHLDVPTINSSQKHEIVEGNTMTLTCTTKGDPIVTYKWIKNGLTIQQGSGTLRIVNIHRKDSGNYQCQAINAVGTKTSNVIVVDVHYIDQPFNEANGSLAVMENGSISINCKASRSPGGTVTWFFKDNKLPQSLMDGTVLQLKNVKRESKGNYTCQFSTTSGLKKSSHAYLDVYYMDKVSIQPGPELTVKEDTPVTFKCIVDANPTPSFRIIKSNTIIVQQSSVYSIKMVKRSQAGIYKCYVYSVAGQKYSGHTTLTVHHLDKPVIDKKTVYKVKEGSTATALCSAEALPPASYYWARDGQGISSKPSVNIANIQRSSSGNYSCTANNTFGSKTSVVFIDVQYLDQPKLHVSRNSTIIEGNAIILNCTVDSNPGATWEWYRNDELLAHSDNMIVIQEIHTRQAGKYYCVAKNVAGRKTSATVFVDVLYLRKPVITTRLGYYEEEGKRVVLSCTVKANPKGIIEWTKNGIKIPGQSSTSLDLGLIVRKQSGNYTCHVSNMVTRNSSNTVHLDVAYVDVPSVIFDPSVEPVEGTTLSLICNSTHRPDVSYTWIRNGVKLSETDRILHIKDIQRSNSNSYQCKVKNMAGMKTSAVGKAKVRYLSTPSLSLSVSNTVREGSPYTLRCSVDGYPAATFKWYKNGNQLSTNGSEIVVTSAAKLDSGAYTCKAHNSADEKTSNAILINVIYLNKAIVNDTQVRNVTEGNTAFLYCSAEGNPPPTYTWRKEHQSFQHAGQELPFLTAKREDTGRYQCIATNSFGSESSPWINVKFIYMDIPTVSIQDLSGPKSQYAVKEFTSLNLLCSSKTNADESELTYEWFKGSQKVLGQSNSSYHRRRATRTYSGIYYCKTWHKLTGERRSNAFSVRVIYMDPITLSLPGERFVYEGTSVKLECNVSSVPSAAYQWKTPKDIWNLRNETISIKEVSRSDSGTYVCNGFNGYTSTSKQMNLTVYYADTPVILPRLTSEFIKENESVSLLCEVNSNIRTMHYRVYKDGKQVSYGLQKKVIEKVQIKRTDMGRYRCTVNVTNTIKRSEEVELNVTYLDTPTVNSSSSKQMWEYDSYVLTCDAVGLPTPTYTWYKNDLSSQVSSGARLKFKNMLRSSAGKYYCCAMNRFGRKCSKPYSFTTQYHDKPKLDVLQPKSTYAKNGSSIAFRCFAHINNITGVTKTTHIKYILEQNGKTVRSVNTYGKLFQDFWIHSVTRVHSGTYTCVAEVNGIIRESNERIIRVAFIEDVAVLSVTSHAQENFATELQCITDAYPSPSFKWYFDNSSSGNGKRMVGTGAVLIMNTTTKADSGYYFCEVKVLDEERLSSAANISVKYMHAPQWQALTPSLSGKYVLEGSRVLLVCNADTNHNPVYFQLHKDGKSISNVSIALDTKSVSRNQSGAYRCRTRNRFFSEISDFYYLHVSHLDKPRTEPSIPITVKEMDGVKIACSVDASPAPMIEWYKGSTKIPGTSYIQTWNRIMKEDSGKYKCCARNAMGTKCSDAINVEVQYLLNPQLNASAVYEVKEFNDVHVFCTVDGNPMPAITWFKDGIRILQGKNSLEIRNISRESAGRYCCAASNIVREGELACTMVNVLFLDKPAISQSNTTRIVIEGNDVSLLCGAKRNPDGDIIWYFKGKKQDSTTLNGTVLQLKNVKRSQKGNYTCVIINSVGTKATSSVSLVVHYHSNIRVNYSGVLSTPENSPLMLNCKSDGFPSPTCRWVHEKSKIVSENGTHQMSKVKRSNAGSYQCICRNDFGVLESAVHHVVVQYLDQPKISEGQSVNATVGSTVILRCLVEAIPLFRIQWWIKSNGSDMPMSSLGTSAQAKISNVTKQQSGYYRCSASNFLGQNWSSYVYVNVHYIERASIFPSTKRTILEGKSVELVCNVDANPAPVIKWLKGSAKLPDVTKTLKLTGVNKSSSGEYYCSAENFVNSQSSNRVTVEVWYIKIPEIVSTNKGYVKEGTAIRLECIVNGLPASKIQWTKDGVTLLETSKTLSLTLENPSKTGNYSCSSSNQAGNRISQAIVITVSYVRKPVLRVSPSADVIEGASAITMICDCVHVPLGSYLWYKNGQRLMGRSGKALTLKTIRKDEAGNYTCEVQNEVDKAISDAVTIKVRYLRKPTIKSVSSTSVKEGEKLQIVCEAESSVPVQFTWKKSGQTVRSGNSPLLSNKIEIQNAVTTDRGDYVCIVSAASMNTSMESVPVAVSITYLRLPTLSLSISGDIWENSVLQMTCNVDSYPQARYRWFKNQQTIAGAQNVFRFNPVKKSDSGTYFCNVTNGIEMKSSETKIVSVQGLTACNPNPCLNDGTCKLQLNSPVCTCSQRFSGSRCQNAMQRALTVVILSRICMRGQCYSQPEAIARSRDKVFLLLIETYLNERLLPFGIRVDPGTVTITEGSIILTSAVFVEGDSDAEKTKQKMVDALSASNNVTGSTGVQMEVVPKSLKVTDLDECATGKHTCSEHATCTNTYGSFSCKCKSGYSGDGRKCDKEEDNVTTTILAIVIFLGILALIILILLGCIIIQRNKTRGKETFEGKHREMSAKRDYSNEAMYGKSMEMKGKDEDKTREKYSTERDYAVPGELQQGENEVGQEIGESSQEKQHSLEQKSEEERYTNLTAIRKPSLEWENPVYQED